MEIYYETRAAAMKACGAKRGRSGLRDANHNLIVIIRPIRKPGSACHGKFVWGYI